MLSRILYLGLDLGFFQGINLTRGYPQISHLLFADDALFFFKASRASCTHVTDIISRFCRISSQQLNLQKSHFSVSPNTHIQDRQDFRTILQMELVPNLEPHLGVLIDLTRKKSLNFQFIIDKVVNKVSSWNSVYLSQTQKLNSY